MQYALALGLTKCRENEKLTTTTGTMAPGTKFLTPLSNACAQTTTTQLSATCSKTMTKVLGKKIPRRYY
jgi:hypothetical protein